jgi:histidine triad (HIT) family protein
MASIFSKIAAGEIPSHKIAENEEFFAFLDISPLAKGHTLVIPKTEIDYIFDIDDEQLAKMIVFAKKVAVGIKKAIPSKRIGMAVIGLEVPHAHIHLVPLNTESDIHFGKPKLTLSQEELADIAASIRKELE